jgi:hypothetical protein
MLVLNKKDDRIPKEAVYVGRPSIFGNPFVIGRDGSRDEVIEKYKDWFLEKIISDPEFAASVLALKSVPALVCWCAPKRCHASVIVELLDSI